MSAQALRHGRRHPYLRGMHRVRHRLQDGERPRPTASPGTGSPRSRRERSRPRPDDPLGAVQPLRGRAVRGGVPHRRLVRSGPAASSWWTRTSAPGARRASPPARTTRASWTRAPAPSTSARSASTACENGTPTTACQDVCPTREHPLRRPERSRLGHLPGPAHPRALHAAAGGGHHAPALLPEVRAGPCKSSRRPGPTPSSTRRCTSGTARWRPTSSWAAWWPGSWCWRGSGSCSATDERPIPPPGAPSLDRADPPVRGHALPVAGPGEPLERLPLLPGLPAHLPHVLGRLDPAGRLSGVPGAGVADDARRDTGGRQGAHREVVGAG